MENREKPTAQISWDFLYVRGIDDGKVYVDLVNLLDCIKEIRLVSNRLGNHAADEIMGVLSGMISEGAVRSGI